MDSSYVWRKAGEAFNPKNTLPTVKPVDGSIMLFGCFAASGPGELIRVHGNMKKEDYSEIIEIMSSSLHSNFLQDGD